MIKSDEKLDARRMADIELWVSTQVDRVVTLPSLKHLSRLDLHLLAAAIDNSGEQVDGG